MWKLDFIPLKKQFIKDIILDNRIKHTIQYEQATIKEFYEFYSLSEEEQTIELLSIIKKDIHYNRIDRILKKIYPKYITHLELLIPYQKIMAEILSTKFRTMESLYKDSDKYDTRKTKAKTTRVLGRNSYANVCKFWNLSFTELIENYTLEQFIWLADWVIYENNAGSKEWQFVNNMALRDTEWIKKRLEENKKLFSKKSK